MAESLDSISLVNGDPEALLSPMQASNDRSKDNPVFPSNTEPSINDEDDDRPDTPLLRDQQIPLQADINRANRTERVPKSPEIPQLNKRPPERKKIVICSLLILTLILLFISPVLLTTLRASSSTCASVYIGDVVYITEVVGFFYNKATITVKPPAGTELETETDIFYVDDANSREREESNHSSQVDDYSFPQGILVQNNTQSYFLSQSEIEFCFQVQVNSSSELAKLAKICQFSNVNDYNALMAADTNKSIAEAEKRGDCQDILKPPNQFKIKDRGYYWYALSIPFSDTEPLQTSYMYHLNKRYYNQTLLGDPYDCSVVASDCVIRGLIGQRSTKHLLVYIPVPDGIIESPDPYEFCVEVSNAWGMVIVVFIPVLLIALVCVIALSVACCYVFKK